MMWLITAFAVIFLSALAADHFKKRITDTLPLAAGILVIILYILAFFRALFLIDLLSLGTLLGTGIFLYRKRKAEGAPLSLSRLTVYLPELFAILAVLLLLTVSQLPKIATWWDDINFWATDAKALRSLNGFAGKYGNAAPEFGDYPPAISLFKWFFLHMSSKIYREGLGFAGYLCMNFLFLLPLLSGVLNTLFESPDRPKGIKRFLICLSVLVFPVLLPTVANVVCFQGTCADVTMGILYGVLLLSVLKDQESIFSFLQIAVYGSVLVLTKSVGIEWAVFAFFFFLLIGKSLRRLSVYLPWIFVLLTEVTWLIFCLINRRVSKLTSAGVRIASSGGGSLIDTAKQKGAQFLEGILIHPMHTDHTAMIDLPLIAFFLLLIALIVILGIRKKYPAGTRNRLLIFTLLTAFIAYGIIFLGHISIFAGETQYETGEVMAISISRYGAPFTIGMMILLLGILTEDKKEDPGKEEPSDGNTRGEGFRIRQLIPTLICAVFVLFTCDYPGVYEGLIGYRTHLEEDRNAREAMIDENGHRFAEEAALISELKGKRILILQDQGTVHWVHNAYLNLEVSPAAPVYESVDPEALTGSSLRQVIVSSHASYVYAENMEGATKEAFSGLLSDDFSFETVYRAEKDGSLSLLTAE